MHHKIQYFRVSEKKLSKIFDLHTKTVQVKHSSMESNVSTNFVIILHITLYVYAKNAVFYYFIMMIVLSCPNFSPCSS